MMMWPSLNEAEKEMNTDDDLFEGGPERCLYNFFNAALASIGDGGDSTAVELCRNGAVY